MKVCWLLLDTKYRGLGWVLMFSHQCAPAYRGPRNVVRERKCYAGETDKQTKT